MKYIGYAMFVIFFTALLGVLGFAAYIDPAFRVFIGVVGWVVTALVFILMGEK